MAIPPVSKFCFCASLKIATTVFAPFCTVLNPVVAYLIYLSHLFCNSGYTTLPLVIMYAIMAGSIITGLLLIVGSAMSVRQLIVPYLIWNIIDFHLTTIVGGYGIILVFKCRFAYGVLVFMIHACTTVFAIYYFVVVCSRFIEMDPDINVPCENPVDEQNLIDEEDDLVEPEDSSDEYQEDSALKENSSKNYGAIAHIC